VALAALQYGTWTNVAVVCGIFIFGQTVEANLLTPKLVGDRIHLHPVWVIFALLAGGKLFGFLGVLVSVPRSSRDRRSGPFLRWIAIVTASSTIRAGPTPSAGLS